MRLDVFPFNPAVPCLTHSHFPSVLSLPFCQCFSSAYISFSRLFFSFFDAWCLYFSSFFILDSFFLISPFGSNLVSQWLYSLFIFSGFTSSAPPVLRALSHLSCLYLSAPVRSRAGTLLSKDLDRQWLLRGDRTVIRQFSPTPGEQSRTSSSSVRTQAARGSGADLLTIRHFSFLKPLEKNKIKLC